jgi:hypothetical protein
MAVRSSIPDAMRGDECHVLSGVSSSGTWHTNAVHLTIPHQGVDLVMRCTCCPEFREEAADRRTPIPDCHESLIRSAVRRCQDWLENGHLSKIKCIWKEWTIVLESSKFCKIDCHLFCFEYLR